MRGAGLLKVEGRIVTEVRNWVGTEGAAAANWKAVSALLHPLRTDPTSGKKVRVSHRLQVANSPLSTDHSETLDS